MYHRTLDNPAVARLPDGLWRRWMELRMYTGELGNGGCLPGTGKIARRLNLSPEKMALDLTGLQSAGLIEVEGGGWRLTGFAEEQAPTPGRVRVKRFRQRQEPGLPPPYPDNWKIIRVKILKRDSEMCVYCGDQATHIDHILPITKGGQHTTNNLVAACERCNKSKKNRDFLTWYLSQDFFNRIRLGYVNSIANGPNNA